MVREAIQSRILEMHILNLLLKYGRVLVRPRATYTGCRMRMDKAMGSCEIGHEVCAVRADARVLEARLES